jgi:hypothetical protein
MKLNMANTDAFMGFDAIEGGTYWAKITNGTASETKNDGKLPAGTPGINWEFTIQDGPNEGRKVWTNTWIHANTIGFVKGLLKATGEFADDELNSDELETDEAVERAIGCDVTIRVTKREYPPESNDYVNDVKSIKPYNGLTSTASGEGSYLP